MTDEIGHQVVAMAIQSLWSAADSLIAAHGPEKLRRLRVRSGEHLGAILTTCFLKAPPTDFDTDGGPDLVFDDLPDREAWRDYWIAPAPLVFEVKSAQGNFREHDTALDRLSAQGGDPSQIWFPIRIRRANDILNDIRPQIEKARRQLDKKARPGDSKNVFVVVHMFDHLAAELVNENFIGAHLAPLRRIGDVDSVWILWAPTRLTVWSAARQEWIGLLFDAIGSEVDERIMEETPNGEVLQSVEEYFLASIGHTEGSPYVFGLTAGDGTL